MVRIVLDPLSIRLVAVVNVVADHHDPAPISHWTLVEELRVRPILIKRSCRCDAHRIDATASCFESRTAHSNDPVVNLGLRSDSRHARRQGTKSVEWVWREAEVPIHNVHVKETHALVYSRRTRMNGLACRAVGVFKPVVRPLNCVNDTVCIPGNNRRGIPF